MEGCFVTIEWIHGTYTSSIGETTDDGEWRESQLHYFRTAHKQKSGSAVTQRTGIRGCDRSIRFECRLHGAQFVNIQLHKYKK
jgi:hypothetical protein